MLKYLYIRGMLFNSFVFLVFFLVFFIIYWAIPSSRLKWQNVVLWLASYIFYGWWDWRYLALIAGASLVSYSGGRLMEKLPSYRKVVLTGVVVFHIAMLAWFKYAGFFVNSAIAALQSLGVEVHAWSLQIALPVGISFFTFQSMSYAIDVYRKKLKASSHLIEYLAFISFFPQLVAGPIERATNLLPQIEKPRFFDGQKAGLGMQLILWGLIKKMLIADSCAPIVQHVFSHISESSAADLWWAALLFAVQIYCDFSAYSEMAMGLALLLGFQLMQNFNYPYFAANIKSFWKRWHISLTTWFKDYVFLPLGGSRVSGPKLVFNVIIVFALSGLWHGANYTFVVWGLYHALLYLVFVLWLESSQFSLPKGLSVAVTFFLVLLGWIFFRAPTIGDAMQYFQGMFLSNAKVGFVTWDAKLAVILLLLLGFEAWNRNQLFGLDFNTKLRQPVRWAIYMVLLTTWLIYGHFEEVSFIYFDF